MQSLFGLELTTAQKVIVASVVILVLLALLGLFVRQIQGGRLRVRGQGGGRQRQPRLGIVDTYDLDRQRQLVLIRRDNVEHLVMVGGASDVVVETNILRSGARAAAPAYSEAQAADRPLPPFETLVPPSEPALRSGDRGASASATADILPPLPTRAAQTQTHAEAAAAAGAGVAAALGVEATRSSAAQPGSATAAQPAPVPQPAPAPSMTAGPAPSFPREHAPAPPVSADELDDMTKQLEAALKRPFSAVRPANLPAEPQPQPESVAPPVKPVASPPPASIGRAEPAAAPPEPAVAREPAKPVEPPRPSPAKAAPSPQAPEPPAAPATPPRSAPVAANMEAELEAVLGLKPSKVAPKPAETKVSETGGSGGKPAGEAPEKKAPAAADEADEPEKPAVESKGEPAPPAAKPEAAKPAEPAREIDPFSVDAIEAEFARLLGRDVKPKS